MGGDKDYLPVLVAYAPYLLLRLLFGYLRMRRRAKEAGKRFHRTLVANGVPKGQARTLTEVYTSMLSLTNLIDGFRGIPFLGRMGPVGR